MTIRPHRVLAAWIAIAAILLGALAPTLSHAGGRGGPSHWIELCTADGMRHVAVDGAGQPAGPGHGSGSGSLLLDDVCSACLGASPGLPPPSVPGFALAVEVDPRLPPSTCGRPSPGPDPWPGASPRGPPAPV